MKEVHNINVTFYFLFTAKRTKRTPTEATGARGKTCQGFILSCDFQFFVDEKLMF